MALLNKLKASTLMETLVATVLIVVVFMVSSMVMNNLLTNKIKRNTALAEERLNSLEYQLIHHQLQLPYYENFQSWEISVDEEEVGQNTVVTLVATNNKTKATVTNYRVYED